ncbi:MAG: hypothetical protein ACI8RD_014841 [Bacillariaceae sp.]|jgi:hypothetical protein
MEQPNHLLEDMKGMSLSGTTTATPTTSTTVGRTTRSAMATNNSGMSLSPPVRRMERNKSGGNRLIKGGRAPPKRSQSQKIGRPTFNPVLTDASTPTERQQQQHQQQQQLQKQQQPTRGVNRSQSTRVKSTTRNAPSRSGSFQRRRVPDRTSSSSSLRRGSTTKRQQQQLGSSNATATTGTIETDDVSVSDSVYTSISIATMDSIAVRKSQMPSSSNGGPKIATTRIEFDDQVGYLNDNNNNDDYESDLYEYEDELSVFSESWCSSESESCEVLSDYEEEEMDGAILEDNEGEDEAEVKSPEIINRDKEECTE